MKYLDDTGLAHLWSEILNVAGDEIYVGTTAPAAGSNYKVWINSSDSLVNVPTLAQVQGLGYQTAAQVQSAISTALGEVENGTY